MKPFYFFCLLFISVNSYAQTGILKGTTLEKDGTKIPFVNIYIKNTTIGTTSNIEGNYQMSLNYGSYDIVIDYIGYKNIVQKIIIATPSTERNFVMLEDNIELAKVEVSSKDPAPEIIKNAQKNRKKYLKEIEKYSCEVYLKGMNRISKIPEKMLERGIGIDTGIIYLSESISELSAVPPNKVKEKMISSKVAGNSNDFSFNKSRSFQINFYQNIPGQGSLAERGLVSPIADNAFNFYTYKMEGFYQENGMTINKIKVIPIRDTDPVYSGSIYIVEGSWRIYATNLEVSKEQIPFISKAVINQHFIPSSSAPNAVWVILSQYVYIDFDVLGITGNAHFMGVYSKYNLNPVFEKNYFTNEVFSISKEANKKDTTYWSGVRPVPLTSNETINYIKKDSVEIVTNTKPYKDSMDRKNNKLELMEIFVTGYSLKNSWKNQTWFFGSVLSSLQFNTVEGGVFNFGMGYSKKYKNNNTFSIEPTIRYGFADLTWKGKLAISGQINAKKRTNIGISGGRFVQQINDTEPIDGILNTSVTLFSELNYLKYYLNDYVTAFYRSEVTNGVYLSASAIYSNRTAMTNHSNFKIFNYKDREFTVNQPTNIELPNTDFVPNTALKLNLSAKFTFNQKYSTRPNMKINEESRYPTLQVAYTRAVPVLGATASYDRLQVDIDGKIKMGLVGNSTFKVFGGTTLNSENLTFADYKHFSGNQIIWSGTFVGYQLLNYYDFSTSKPYAGINYDHHFGGALFRRVKGFRKLQLKEVLSVNYLAAGNNGNYVEVGFGFEKIQIKGIPLLRLGYYVSFLDGTYQDKGFRVGVGL